MLLLLLLMGMLLGLAPLSQAVELILSQNLSHSSILLKSETDESELGSGHSRQLSRQRNNVEANKLYLLSFRSIHCVNLIFFDAESL